MKMIKIALCAMLFSSPALADSTCDSVLDGVDGDVLEDVNVECEREGHHGQFEGFVCESKSTQSEEVFQGEGWVLGGAAYRALASCRGAFEEAFPRCYVTGCSVKWATPEEE